MRQRATSLVQLGTGPDHVGDRPILGAYRDFLLILVATAALFLLIGFEPWLEYLSPFRLLLGFAFVLFIPGYCLAAALFPRSGDLDGPARIGLSMGLSIAWVPVLALILNSLPGGLDLWSITLGEALSILAFAAVAIWRRSRLSAVPAFASDVDWEPLAWWSARSMSERWIYATIAAALLIGGLSVTWVLVTPSSSEVTTEFYMLGSEGLAESYPRDAVVGEDLTVTLGATNQEQEDHNYYVEVWVEDSWTPNRRQRVATVGPITLDQEENREWPITWSMPWAGPDQKVEFLLFFSGSDTPYRQLYFYLDVSE